MGYARSALADLWNRYVPRTSTNTSNTATQDYENADPTRENGRVGSVLDDDSRSNTGSDKAKQADVLDVLDVLPQVRNPLTNGVPTCQVDHCDALLYHPHSAALGLCLPHQKQQTEETLV
jgi:hypothetical protein